MSSYLLRRLAQLALTLLLASAVIFAIITLSPGDPVAMRLGTEATPEQIQVERSRLGLDQPLIWRYGVWLGDALRLDFGRSIINRQDVWTLISLRIPATLELAILSMAVSIGVGLALGIAAALRRDSRLDALVTAGNALALSLPSFWLGVILILVFSIELGWLPPSGREEMAAGAGRWRYLVMPVTCLAFQGCAIIARFTRSAMIDVLSADYVRTARAKGLGERAVLLRHALRASLIPVVTVVGIHFGRVLGGAVVVESVFSWPGLGRLVVYSILNKDFPVVQGVLLVVVAVFLLVSLAVDLMYAYIDPRIKLRGASS